MAALHEIGFETPENYKETALNEGALLLDDVLDSARHLNTVRRAGLFDDFAAAENAEEPNYGALSAKMAAAGYSIDANDMLDILAAQYPDTEFAAKTLDELRQEIKDKGLADDAALAQAEARAKVDYALDRFADARDTAENPHLRGLDALAEKAQNDPKLQEKLQLLAGYYEQAFNGANGNEQQGYALDAPRPGANRAAFSYDEARESLSLKVMDLNGTGLNFALNINKATDKPQSLVLTNDNSEMSEAQIQELARFFYKGGLVKNPDLISLSSDIKVLGDSGKNFREIFNEAFMAEQNAQTQTEEKEKQDLPKEQSTEGATNAGSGSQGDDYDDYLTDKPLKPDYRVMRGAMKARAGIMGFRENRLHWRRNLDGSMTLIAYLNEADERTDSELDKKGIQSRKKAFAVNVHKGPPPRARLYIEPGKEIKSGHAKLILKAFQSQGCEYFTAGPTTELSGAGNSAFWKAAGSIPICPKLKRSDDDDGFDGFANDNLQEMLKVHKEEAKIDPEQSLLWKMRLVRELRGYTQYKARKGKRDGKLETATAMIEGDIKFSKFTSSHQSVIESYIREQSRPDNPNRWTTADMASAVMASEELLYAIANGQTKDGKPFKYDYINQKPEKLIDSMVVMMAKNRPIIDKMIDARYESEKRAPKDPEDETTQGSALERAANKVLKEAKDNLNSYVEGDLVSNYGDAAKIKINFPSATPPTAETRYRDTPQASPERTALYKQNRQARIPMPERGSRGA